ncbi:glycosyltransferase family 39 protein [Microbacterium schleiferi]|uniref:glycosyltransferase family 39 protein n=1 Tax=Microbacterium schleiferi TaxID=69362 RepID=UPI00311EEB70
MTISATARERVLVVLAGCLILSVQLIWLERPSYWYDEVATVSGATRSWSSLLAMFQNVDMVHAAYYLIMNAWTRVAGSSEFAMRFPSALAVSLTAVALYFLGARHGGRTVAVLAGILYLLLPRVMWSATEARSFAFAALAATLVVLCLSWALTIRNFASLVVFTVAAALSVFVFMYNALVIAGIVLGALVYPKTRRRGFALLIAATTAAIVVSPFLLAVLAQRAQLGGTRTISVTTWYEVAVEQYFLDNPLASAAWVAALVGGGIMAITGRRRRGDIDPRQRLLLFPILGWLILPQVLILSYSAMAPSIYQPRALTISAPALALASAWLLRSLRRWHMWAVVFILALTTVPSAVALREPEAKNTDWRSVADLMASLPVSATAVIYAPPQDVNSYVALVRLAYPSSVEGIADPTLITPAEERAYLFDNRTSPLEVAPQLAQFDRVLVVLREPDPDFSEPMSAELTQAGFENSEKIDLPLTTLQVWDRSSQLVP